ncbi:hypothetical protein AN3552.2 [Aspergillus nidulans FGSC A4]|uniref:Uncharacterized protein n=1 Tax=Emericella nidulans (strain FGSC A4 / ATCC 38163 / CBS 112.46 / NRRL 194 / M139) TaxID=227321 RepID=Q5B7C8_EMENI|nr:hypothetical protein [Aspergillus nidulans FGSC A4]EAA59760.1 hypothetical protein AN3552.2 [Aspergillus nidulans FGSC A4]CBF75902.1 TPA: hypothetical protein ANIA_03552 [Aspergillus nidulans FGSC A4]|eukprot:XP_661156.1 hypothetical protein AN3552.2 [Aspergillus nidulans FGSC A4]
MFDAFYLNDSLGSPTHLLLSGLATILPLSTWIGFINAPLVLHLFELTGQIPLWSWAVSNEGRKLLGEVPAPDGKCVMDRFGRSPNLVCLDGRYGDKYFAANPETLRLCVGSTPAYQIKNQHTNLALVDKRVHDLAFIHVWRAQDEDRESITTASLFPRLFSWTGWAVLLAFVAAAIYLHCWVAIAYLAVVPATGMAVYYTRGGPRKLRMDASSSQYQRLVITANHMNETAWQVFYGESTVVNRLLNWPLKSHTHPSANHWLLRLFLQAMIMGQWVLVVLASAWRTWDAYLISGWIAFSVFSNSWVFTPDHLTAEWMARHAGIRMKRYCTQLSSRRALLNTLIALNPDSFPTNNISGRTDTSKISEGGFAWIDPILKKGDDRTRWENSTRYALVKAMAINDNENAASRLGAETHDFQDHVTHGGTTAETGTEYWHPFIHEGIQMARLIVRAAGLDQSAGDYDSQASASNVDIYPGQGAGESQAYYSN